MHHPFILESDLSAIHPIGIYTLLALLVDPAENYLHACRSCMNYDYGKGAAAKAHDIT